MADERKQFLKLTRPDLGRSYTIPIRATNTIEDEMRDREPGDVLHVTLVEMTQEEYDAMPEFDGW